MANQSINNYFAGKVIVISGASRGIGAAIAEAFANANGQVVTLQRSNHPTHATISTNLADSESCKNSINQVLAKFGKIDVLINNAGVMIEETDSIEQRQQAWQQTLAINLTAPYLLAQYASASLAENRGNIINISSIEGSATHPNHSAYAASKAGLDGLTRGLAVDLGGKGIRCNAIAPGWIDTELNQAFIEAQGDNPQFHENLKNIHPLKRTGKSADIAELALWLASDAAGFISGQVFNVDGGRTVKLSLP